MATELVGLIFQAGLHEEDDLSKGWRKGNAKYPDFNLVDPSLRRNMDWCYFVDSLGVGALYDTESGHKQHSIDSPVGEQTCVVTVPQDFATDALAKCPGVRQLTPAEFEDFYDNKAHVTDLEEVKDDGVLEMIEAKEKAGLPVPEKTNAHNPNRKEPGIRKNLRKRWKDFKSTIEVEIV
jgi:hypothetical protein